MYHVLKDFAGPVATILAAGAAVFVTAWLGRQQAAIAREQARTSKEKLRLDLFDRRWATYSSIFDFYEVMISWAGSPEQAPVRARFFRAAHQSQYLFSPEASTIMKHLQKEGEKAIGLKELLAKPLGSVDAPQKVEWHREMTHIHTTVFESGLMQLEAAVAPYLSFDE